MCIRDRYKQLDIGRIVDNVDILVAKLVDNTMNTATLHTHAGTYRVCLLYTSRCV